MHHELKEKLKKYLSQKKVEELMTKCLFCLKRKPMPRSWLCWWCSLTQLPTK